MLDIRSFINQSFRVWRLLKKPSVQEFTTISKVSAIGLGIVGLIGFVIAMVMEFLGLI